MGTKPFVRKYLGLVFLLIFVSATYSQTAESYYSLAYQASMQKDYNLVLVHASKALELNPDYGAAYWIRGLAKSNLKDYTGGLSDYSRAISYYQDDTNLAILYVNRSDCKLALHDYDGAFADCNIAILKNPVYANAYWYRGRANHNKKEYRKAIDDYGTAINYLTDNNDLAIVYVNRSDCKRYLSDYDGALADCNAALSKNPAYGRAYWYKGLAYGEKWEYKNAVDEYLKAIPYYTGENASLAILNNNIASCKYYLKEYDEGLIYVNRSLAFNPLLVNAYWYRGMIYDAKGENILALESYDKAISYESNNEQLAKLYYNKAIIRNELKEYVTALQDFSKVIGYNPEYALAYEKKADILYIMKDYRNAAIDYGSALKFNAGDKSKQVRLLNFRADCLTELNDFGGAIADYTNAIGLSSDNIYSYEQRGKLYYYKLNDREKAKPDFIKVAELDMKGDTSATYSYAKIYIGEKDAAISNMQRLIKKHLNSKDLLSWDYHNLACIYAIAGDEKNTLKFLDESFKNGFKNFDHLDNDEDLKIIKNNASYKVMISKYRDGKTDAAGSSAEEINAEVNAAISSWEQKGEFETTAAYNERLKSRESKIKILTNSITSKYKQAYLKEINWKLAALGTYHADLQTFPLALQDVYDIELHVPLAEAALFKANLSKLIYSAQDMALKDGKWTLIYLKISNPANQKSYIYSKKD